MSLHKEDYLAALQKAGDFCKAHPYACWLALAVAIAFIAGRCTG